MALDLTTRQVLALLGSNLRNEPTDTLPFRSKEIDWKRIFDIAANQSIFALIFSAVGTLPQEMQPSERVMLNAYMIANKIEKYNSLLFPKVLSDILETLGNVDVHPVLLKGQSVAMYYPQPFLRSSGDIDLCIKEDEYERAYIAAQSLGCKVQEKPIEQIWHLAFEYKGVHIEFHRPFKHKTYDNLRKWLSHELFNNCKEIDINGVKVMAPSDTFNASYIFLHLAKHFNDGEDASIRQLCDFLMCLHKCKDSIDPDTVRQNINQTKYEYLWHIFESFGKYNLGIAPSDIMGSSHYSKRKAEALMKLFLQNGMWNINKQSRKFKLIPNFIIKMKSLSYLFTINCSFALKNVKKTILFIITRQHSNSQND